MSNPITNFRKDPKRAAWAGKLMSHPFWAEMVQIMQESEHPRFFDSPGLEPTQKLGRIEGWDLYNTTLKAFAVPLVEPVEVPATFEPEELPEQPKGK